MNKDVERWFLEEGENLLKKVGVRPGDLVLDFGCGNGCYTIPAAKRTGERGVVYALDTRRYALKELVQEASNRNLGNVVPVHSIDELKKTLGVRRLNVLLLFDVIHHYYFSNRQRINLLRSLAPMVIDGGIVSIFPRHMGSQELEGVKNELSSLGFRLESEMETELLHDQRHASGRIYNFSKLAAARDLFASVSAR